MTRNKLLRWIGTVSYIIGIALSAANVYPVYLLFQANGAVFWVAAGIGVKDVPLIILEGYALISYGGGLIYAIWKFL